VTVLLNATFASDTEGFSAGSQVGSEGADFSTGYLSVGAGVTAIKSFSAVSSGILRVEWWIHVPDDETSTDTTKNTTFYILPTAGAVSLANSLCAVVVSRRSTSDGTTSLKFRLRVN